MAGLGFKIARPVDADAGVCVCVCVSRSCVVSVNNLLSTCVIPCEYYLQYRDTIRVAALRGRPWGGGGMQSCKIL